jgi:hypothetical protein
VQPTPLLPSDALAYLWLLVTLHCITPAGSTVFC